MESDELNAGIKKSEAELKAAEKEVAAERAVLETEQAGLQAEINRTTAEREKLVADIDRHVLAIFETTAKGRKGVAVAEAKDGLCTICHVRLRPQVFNEVRKNESIIQCDSCRRILYFAGSPEASAPVSQV
jgi:predicted  nucleic acid-binding Zn-ribbon protein